MDPLEIKLIGMADQANASRREGIKAMWRVSDILFEMAPAERQRAVGSWSPVELAGMQILAEDGGNQQLTDLIGSQPEFGEPNV